MMPLEGSDSAKKTPTKKTPAKIIRSATKKFKRPFFSAAKDSSPIGGQSGSILPTTSTPCDGGTPIRATYAQQTGSTSALSLCSESQHEKIQEEEPCAQCAKLTRDLANLQKAYASLQKNHDALGSQFHEKEDELKRLEARLNSALNTFGRSGPAPRPQSVSTVPTSRSSSHLPRGLISRDRHKIPAEELSKPKSHPVGTTQENGAVVPLSWSRETLRLAQTAASTLSHMQNSLAALAEFAKAWSTNVNDFRPSVGRPENHKGPVEMIDALEQIEKKGVEGFIRNALECANDCARLVFDARNDLQEIFKRIG